MLTRLARWWLARKVRDVEVVVIEAVEECETCGAELRGDDVHAIVAHFDDAALGLDGSGGTMGRADFCAEHCPGGCARGCATLTG